MSPAEWGSHEVPAVDRFPRLHLPDSFQTLGRGAWLLVGIALLLAIAFLLLGLISDLVIPLVFAAILAAIFVPLVDRLERWRVPPVAGHSLQNLLEPVAFGRILRLHPLTVVLVTTAGTLLLGVLGAMLAAPVTAVTLRTIGLPREAGLFGGAATRPAAAAEQAWCRRAFCSRSGESLTRSGRATTFLSSMSIVDTKVGEGRWPSPRRLRALRPTRPRRSRSPE